MNVGSYVGYMALAENASVLLSLETALAPRQNAGKTSGPLTIYVYISIRFDLAVRILSMTPVIV